MAPEAQNYENYGCVSLKLPATWKRSRYEYTPKPFLQSMVGHENGVADAYLTKDPRAKHQFSWCHPHDEDKVDYLREQGYAPITKDTWTKNPYLWVWGAEGFCVRMGDHLWARPAQLFYEEEEAKKPRDLDKEAEEKLIERGGGVLAGAADMNGAPLRPTSRK